MSHIMIVHDDPRVARNVREYLALKDHRVTVCMSALQALGTVERESPDLIVMDAQMAGMTGLDLCRRLRDHEENAHLPIIILLEHATVEEKIAAFEAGGDDYMARPVDLRELSLRVAALTRRSGSRKSAERVTAEVNVGRLVLDRKTYRARLDGREIPLTPVEFELLRYLMARSGEVISSERLLQEVWHYYPGTGDPAVVRVQIKNLREKIEHDRTQPEFIHTVYRHGYMVAA